MFSLASVFSNAGPVGLFTMLLLLVFSLLSWTIIFAKWRSLLTLNRSNRSFINLFWQVRDINELLSMSANTKKSPSAIVYRDGLEEYNRQKNYNEGLLLVERALSRSSRNQLDLAEKSISWLATIGAISPFVGLFGTVIGIMSSFHQIGLLGNASLASVAPGIAEALFSTALGLFAAIPAVMAYNIFQSKIRELRADLSNFNLDLLAQLKSKD